MRPRRRPNPLSRRCSDKPENPNTPKTHRAPSPRGLVSVNRSITDISPSGPVSA
ncbi:hypothetical protein I549_2729 [Mycobacterium avium subsp. avium 2285 (R)]|nr:hypothetical protein I549_2729 [Mycobacterium avium subsp. avium 2285 (R)]